MKKIVFKHSYATDGELKVVNSKVEEVERQPINEEPKKKGRKKSVLDD